MITLADATQKAEQYVQKMGPVSGIPLRLRKDLTIARSFGWIFFYDAAPLPGSEEAVILLGNAPIIIDKRDGSLHVTGTARSIEYYVDNYERTGSPFSE